MQKLARHLLYRWSRCRLPLTTSDRSISGGSDLTRLFVFAFIVGMLCQPCHGAAAEGVKHRIDLTASIDSGSTFVKKGVEMTGALTVSVRVSANSRESRYYGVLSPTFVDLVLPERPGIFVKQTKIWEEGVCHQRRGLPKVTVTDAGGSFGHGGTRVDIRATNRHIGLRIPSDELMPGMKLPAGQDDIGPFYAVRAVTKNSGLLIDLKIYTFDCNI